MKRKLIGSVVSAGGLFLMMETSALAQSGTCKDAWVNKAVNEVVGRAPRGSGTSGECDPRHYSPNGNWSSYRDLLNKVAVKLTNKGAAYVFIAPYMAVLQGHVGWAYANNDGTYEYGATDAPGGHMKIPAGNDTNSPWRGKVETEAQLFEKFRQHYAGPFIGYNQVKHTFVNNRSQGGADQKALSIRHVGYNLIGNNCLDHTYAVLNAYGIPTSAMPWKQTNPTPNGWFSAFYSLGLNNSLKPTNAETL